MRAKQLGLSAAAALLAMMAGGTGLAQQAAQAPKAAITLRGAGSFIVLSAPGDRAILLENVQVSSAYDDAMTYKVFDRTGAVAGKGEVQPGKSAQVAVSGGKSPFFIRCRAGRNAIRVGSPSGAVVADVRASRRLHLFGPNPPLYFRLLSAPCKVEIYAEEPALVAFVAPGGKVIWQRSIPDHTRVKAELAGPAGRQWWRLDTRPEGDVILTFDTAVEGLFAAPALSPAQQAALASMVLFDGLPLSAWQFPQPPRRARQLSTRDGLSLRISPSGAVALELKSAADSPGPTGAAGAAAGGAGHIAAKGAKQAASGTGAASDDQAATAQGGPKSAAAAGESSGLRAFAGGFAVRDHTAGGRLAFGRGSASVSANRATWRLRFEGTPLSVRAEAVAHDDYVVVDTTISSRDRRDRAVTLYFILPMPAAERFCGGIDHSTAPIAGSSVGVFGRTPAGAVGQVSQYPLGCAAGQSGAVALAVPLDSPRIFRIGYAAPPGALYVAFDVAVTPKTRKFPSRASVRFYIFRCGGRWPFREALSRYYRIDHDSFVMRVPKLGGWVCWGHLRDVPNFRDYGFQYHWGPRGADAVAYDNEQGVYAFLYNDSVRYFADLGEFEKRPTVEQANEVFRKLFSAEDPRAFILSRPRGATGRARYEALERRMGREGAERWLRQSIQAALKSACVRSDGLWHVGYIINRKDWGPPGVNWWTGRLFCNPDPDIPGGWGQFLFDRIIFETFSRYEQAGARYDGVGLDNYFVYAHMLDFREEHFAYVDHPLSFDMESLRPAAVGDFLLYEWVEELARRMRAQGRWLIANLGHWPYPFAARLLDIHGFEWGIERSAGIARALAYHKPVVSLPVLEEHYAELFLRKHVRFAFVPGGYATRSFAARGQVRELYRRYVPAILDCARAGWEPVPWAWADSQEVKVERFGGPGGPLLFTVVNESERAASCRVVIDAARLGLRPVAVRARELIGGGVVVFRPQGNLLAAQVTLQPEQAMVLRIR